jgi:putative lipoic acid-binding regulatory protein
MSDNHQEDAFYEKLKKQLQDTSMWPSPYLFKFIIKSDAVKVNQINTIFDNLGAVIETKPSKKGNYTSVSINVKMKDPDAVIDKYKQVAEKVEGVISL